MKVMAHPMLVAVALGFLSPGALAAEEDDSDAPERNDRSCLHCTCEAADLSACETDDAVASALDDSDDPYWTRLSMADEPMTTDLVVSHDEWDAVEAAWNEARLSV